jgi:cyclopropane-fatty-acyl-phospholipid synthase
MLNTVLAKNIIPDPIVRFGIKKLLKQRIKEDIGFDENIKNRNKESFLARQKTYPIAVNTRDANEQHYEVPTDFYHYVLGIHKKYSCGLWDNADNLDQAEKAMLELTTERARLENGLDILELGCGWGSLTLFMAAKYPKANITGVSNSNTQRDYILTEAKKRGLNNIDIITCDINQFTIEKKFDRIVSVEMFEHMRNYDLLLGKIKNFLKDDGKLFVHIFVHKDTPYFFDVKDESDWMSKYFFSGGIMPSDDIFTHFKKHFNVVEHNRVNGVHYSLTAEAWLQNQDRNKQEIMELFIKHYGEKEALKWFSYWRIFFMACSELWKYKKGNEWFVSHYLMEKEHGRD